MENKVTAIILAAGESRRMGQPKLLLPWGNGTILGAVIETIREAGANDILVVTGGARERVEEICARHSARTIQNDQYATEGMLSSIQCGISALKSRAALICLGDQPQVRKKTVEKILSAFSNTNLPLVVPSYQNRRGHPWLVDRSLWTELMSLAPGQSPRDFLSAHEKDILYVPVDNDSVLRDLDTPEEYERQKP